MMRSISLAIVAMGIALAPAWGTGGRTPPNIPQVTQKKQVSVLQQMTNRAKAARTAFQQAQAAQQAAAQKHQALIAQHTPLLQQRAAERTRLKADGAKTANDVKQGLPGAKARRANHEQEYKNYVANLKTPAEAAEKAIADAKSLSDFHATDVASKQGDFAKTVKDLRHAQNAAKEKEARRLSREFPQVPVDDAPLAPSAVAAVADSANVSTTANPVTPPVQSGGDDKAARAKAVVERAKANQAARDAQAARIIGNLPPKPSNNFDTMYSDAPSLQN
jgi:DNA repair exonuclease SbcCD ATPase subunit